MAIPRTTSPGAKRLDVKDVSDNGSGQSTPGALPNVSSPRPDAPSSATPRASGGMSTGETGGNFKQPAAAVGAGFPQVGVGDDE